MKALKKIKLLQINKVDLKEKEMQLLMGGYSSGDSCGDKCSCGGSKSNGFECSRNHYCRS